MANPNHGNRSNNLQHLLPINNITKIMKKALPPNAKISKESKLAVRECLYEFITFFTSEANDKCRRDKKKTVTANHLLSAMESLGFEDYLDPLKLYSAKYKEVAELGPGYYSQFYREGPLYGSQHQMEGRKWEELPEGCLVEVFEKVGVQSLLAVPLVCKSWYKAASSPQCWTKLIITYQPSCPRWFYNLKRRRKRPSCSPEEAIIKLTIARSQGSANILEFPRGFSVTKPLLNFAAERCPSINTLSLPNGTTGFSISHLFSRWKNLETLKLGSSAYLADIVAQISTHCPNFARLHLQSLHIDNKTASAIATHLPNIKFLDLKFAFLDKESLVSILQGCKKLEYFDISWIFRFSEVDDETLKLGSHIKTFKHEFKEEEDYYESYECDCCYASPPSYNATRVNANDYDYDYDYDY